MEPIKMSHVERRYENTSHCSCGAHWSHPKERTEAEKDSIFQSHVKYFENKTVVL